MSSAQPLIRRLMDGTIKHWNFFTGQQAWSIPGRDERPEPPRSIEDLQIPMQTGDPEDLCDFCASRHARTPPEKERLIDEGATFTHHVRLPAAQALATPAAFRRIANLFEILPLDYWRKNHGYTPPDEILDWQNDYLESREGFDHLIRILSLKRPDLGIDGVRALSKDELKALSLPFFAGSHDLIVARRHLKAGARIQDELCSSGSLTLREHRAFLEFTISAASRLTAANPHATYVAIFQNWLKPAGASFNHLHKQLVGTDDSGPVIDSILEHTDKERRAFNHYLEALHKENLVIAANAHAVAAADTGQPNPAVVVLSFDKARKPEELDDAALEGLSDLVHACHAAWDPKVPANEEWRYTPNKDCAGMPVHIVLRWRINICAGFEGATGLHINPIDPAALRERMVDRLLFLRNEKALSDLAIGDECSIASIDFDY